MAAAGEPRIQQRQRHWRGFEDITVPDVSAAAMQKSRERQDHGGHVVIAQRAFASSSPTPCYKAASSAPALSKGDTASHA